MFNFILNVHLLMYFKDKSTPLPKIKKIPKPPPPPKKKKTPSKQKLKKSGNNDLLLCFIQEIIFTYS